MTKIFIFFFHFLVFCQIGALPWTNSEGKKSPFPFQFAISENKIVESIPEKDLDFAPLIPGDLSTYIYNTEIEFYKDYQRSYYAVTRKKGGWDCMRHYEILANGCIPYFIDLDKCDSSTMSFLPRELILEAMQLPGVSYLHIDHQIFDKSKYFALLNKLLDYTRNYLTTKVMANYLLKTIDYKGTGKILYLSNDPWPDYMRCLTLAGLKEILKNRVVDVPKIEHIYKTYEGNIAQLYGKGISYTKNIEDFPVDREDIEQRIQNKEFDLIIYGSVLRGLRFHDLVLQTYEPEKIVYICGEDHPCFEQVNLPILFLREFEGI